MNHRVLVNAWLLIASGFLLSPSWAQNATPAKPASSSNEIKTPFLDNYTPSEEVQRRALGPLRIIRSLGEATQKKAAAAAAANVPAPAAPAPKPKIDESATRVAKAVQGTAPANLPANTPVAAEEAPPVAAAVVTPPAAQAVAAAVAAPAKEPNLQIIPVSQVAPVPGRNVMRDVSKALVRVAFDINMDGKTSGVEIVSSNNRKFNSAVVEAVAQWRFKPIDEAVRVETEIAYSAE